MAFPTVSLLDSFKRANENPLSNGGKWTVLLVNKETGTKEPNIGEVVEESYRATEAFVEALSAAFWNVTEFTNPAVAALLHKGFGGGERYAALYCSVKEIPLSAPKKYNGYRALFEEQAAGEVTLKIQKFKESGAFTTIIEKKNVSMVAGDLIGLSVENNQVKAWRKSGAGEWAEIVSAFDATYNTGFVGIGARGNIGLLQNFEAAGTSVFPAVSLLDNFNRANESPLSNEGKWAAITGLPSTGISGSVVSNRYGPKSFVAGKEDAAYWTPTEYEAPVGVSIETKEAEANAERFDSIFACLGSPTTAEKATGYRAKWITTAAAKKVEIKVDIIKLNSLTKVQEVVQLALTKVETWEPGDLLGLSAQEGKVIAWHKHGAEAWSVVSETGNNEFTKGFVGIGGSGSNAANQPDNFEAGRTSIKPEKLTAKLEPKTVSPFAKLRLTTKALQATIGAIEYGAQLAASMLGAFQLSAMESTSIAKLGRNIEHSLAAKLEFKGKVAKVFAIRHKLLASLNLMIRGSLIENMVPDPSFEYDAIGSPPSPTNTFWGAYVSNPPTTHNVVAGGVFGSQCLEIVTPATLQFEGNGVKCGEPELGVSHNGSIYLKGNAGGEKIQIVMEAVTPGNHQAGLSSINVTLTTEWQRFELNVIPKEVEAEVPNHIYIAARTQGGPFAYTWFIDGVMIVPNATKAPEYFDGDTPDGEWLGTEGKSPSTLSALAKSIKHGLTAKLTFLGAIPRNIEHSLSGALTFAGHLSRSTVITLSGSLTFAKELPRKILHGLTAQLESSGSLSRQTLHDLLASLSSTGVLSRNTSRKVSASLGSEGALGKDISHAVAGSLSYLGLLQRDTTHSISASLSFSGVLQRTINHVLTATLTFLGSMRPIGIKNLLADLSFEGSLKRNILHTFTALLTFSTRLFDHIIYGLMADLSFAGTLTHRFELIKRLTASLEFTGVLQRLITATQTGKLSFVGSLSSRVRYGLSASLSFIGSIASRTTTRAQTAALSFSGSVQSRFTKVLEATLAFTSALERRITHRLSGSLSFAGAIRSSGKFIQNLAASLEFAGVLPRSTNHTFTAIVSFSGKTSREIYYRLKATVAFAGTSGRSILHQLRAELNFIGSLIPNVKFVRVLAATLSFNGRTNRSIRRALKAALRFVGGLDFEKIRGLTPIPDILILRHEEFPTLTLRYTSKGNIYGLVNHLKGFPEMEMQSIVRRHQVFRRKE